MAFLFVVDPGVFFLVEQSNFLIIGQDKLNGPIGFKSTIILLRISGIPYKSDAQEGIPTAESYKFTVCGENILSGYIGLDMCRRIGNQRFKRQFFFAITCYWIYALKINVTRVFIPQIVRWGKHT